ncbi:unnamed protein product [Paramecium primaurelia]|uniref:Uncharacterized protein n=1 Tax=Paramecium primaurelia TaxID=5886 RepID=A0A8S1KUH6_PARPR|nr:unnamed protein product [Paramecium primaurelia]
MKGKMNSPRLQQGILSGEGVDREVEAYLIDQSSGHYHNVPITDYDQFFHPAFHAAEQYKQFQYEKIPIKEGSFQLYIKHDDNVGNFGSGLYPSFEARKQPSQILEFQIVIEMKKIFWLEKKKLIKPLVKLDKLMIIFLYLLIMVIHFQIVSKYEEMKQYEEKCFIDKIDPIKDVQILREKVKLREICLRNVRISATLLKLCAQVDLTIHIFLIQNNQFNSEILYRENPDELSTIEIAINKAEYNQDNNIRVPKGYSNLKEKIFSNNLIKKSFEFDSFTLQIQERPKLEEILQDEDENSKLNNDTMIKDNQKIQTSDKKLARVQSQQVIKRYPNPIEKVWNDDFFSHSKVHQ